MPVNAISIIIYIFNCHITRNAGESVRFFPPQVDTQISHPLQLLPKSVSGICNLLAYNVLLQAGSALSHSPLSRSTGLTNGLNCLGGHMKRQREVTSWVFLLLCEPVHAYETEHLAVSLTQISKLLFSGWGT